MKSLLWIILSIVILIVAWPFFVFLLVVAIVLMLFAPKRVMVFKPQQRPSHQTHENIGNEVIDVDADVTIIDEDVT
jgi:hypothetical protein